MRGFFRWLVALFFLAAGVNHFRAPEMYAGMMPPWLPWPDAANVLSGAAEIAGAIGILLPRTRRLAGWGLILLLVAIFPANVHAAVQGRMPPFEISPVVLWLRLPFQAVFIAAVWWVAVARPRAARIVISVAGCAVR